LAFREDLSAKYGEYALRLTVEELKAVDKKLAAMDYGQIQPAQYGLSPADIADRERVIEGLNEILDNETTPAHFKGLDLATSRQRRIFLYTRLFETDADVMFYDYTFKGTRTLNYYLADDLPFRAMIDLLIDRGVISQESRSQAESLLPQKPFTPTTMAGAVAAGINPADRSQVTIIQKPVILPSGNIGQTSDQIRKAIAYLASGSKDGLQKLLDVLSSQNVSMDQLLSQFGTPADAGELHDDDLVVMVFDNGEAAVGYARQYGGYKTLKGIRFFRLATQEEIKKIKDQSGTEGTGSSPVNENDNTKHRAARIMFKSLYFFRRARNLLFGSGGSSSKDFAVLYDRDRGLKDQLAHQGYFPKIREINSRNADGNKVTKAYRISLIDHQALEDEELFTNVSRQVAHILLSKEETEARKGRLSTQETELMRRHRSHFDHFARAIGRIIRRNPLTLTATNAQNKIVGVVFVALGNVTTIMDLPGTSVGIAQWHELHDPRSTRNTLVDFWFTGSEYGVAEAMIDASLDLAVALRSLNGRDRIGLSNVFAYSNPRGLPSHPDPQMTADKYARGILIGFPYQRPGDHLPSWQRYGAGA
jgi:hypothetical protein